MLLDIDFKISYECHLSICSKKISKEIIKLNHKNNKKNLKILDY